MTADRGLAGAFNSQIVRSGTQLAASSRPRARSAVWYASGRRGVSSLNFRGRELAGGYTGFTDRPTYTDARTHRRRRDQLPSSTARVDRVEIFYNAYVSPLTQVATRETLLPASAAATRRR